MNSRRFRIILLIAISASLGGVTYKVVDSIWRMKSKAITKTALKALDYLPEAALHIKDFHRAQVDGERKVWEVFGDEARYLKAEGQVIIQKPRIFFYQKKNNDTVEAIGKEGYLWLGDGEGDLQKARLVGDVQVNFRGYVLNTGEILYFKSKNQMVLPGRVIVKGDGMELDGVQMEISLDDEKMWLHKNVKTTVQPNQLEKKKGRSNEKKQS